MRRFRLHALAIALALAGGVLGTVGAVVEELQSGAIGPVLVVFAAPMIEEAMKPAGVYVLLARWPGALLGRLHTALLTALSGLVFAAIESALYVTVYYTDGGSDYVLFRFTVPLAMHVGASFLVGLGLSQGTMEWAFGRADLPKATRNFYIAGGALHGSYNAIATVLEVTGILEF